MRILMLSGDWSLYDRVCQCFNLHTVVDRSDNTNDFLSLLARSLDDLHRNYDLLIVDHHKDSVLSAITMLSDLGFEKHSVFITDYLDSFLFNRLRSLHIPGIVNRDEPLDVLKEALDAVFFNKNFESAFSTEVMNKTFPAPPKKLLKQIAEFLF